MARSPQRRRRVLVVQGFQAQFVITQLIWVLAAFLGLIVLIIGPLVYQLLAADSSVPLDIADRFLFFHSSLLPFLIVLFGLLAIVFLVMSHRVAGPIYRFQQVFREVAQGRLTTTVRLRDRDYLKPEADDLDKMLRSLRGRIALAQQEAQGLRRRFDALLDGPAAASRSDLQRLASGAMRVCEALDAFVVDPARAAGETAATPAAKPVEATDRSAGFSLIELILAMWIVCTLAALAVPGYVGALDAARVARAIGDIHALGQEIMIEFVRNGCFPDTLADIGRDSLHDPWGRPYHYGVTPSRGPSSRREPPAGPGLGAHSADVAVAGVHRSERCRDGSPDVVLAVASRAGTGTLAKDVRLVAAQGRGGGGGAGGSGGGSGSGGSSGGAGGAGGSGGGPQSGCAACDGTCLSMGEVRKDGRLVPLNSDFDLYSVGKDGLSVGPLTSAHSQDDVVRASNGGFIGLAKKY